MALEPEISEEPISPVIQDMTYAALGIDVKKYTPILLSAVQNSGRKGICILHVHRPAQVIPFMGAQAPVSSMEEKIVREYHKTERQHMNKIMDAYVLICRKLGLPAQKLVIETDCIKKGIVEAICQHGIKKLVMGAVVKKNRRRNTMEPKSDKAKYVCERAAISCHIQFVCKGLFIFSRPNEETLKRDVEALGTAQEALTQGKTKETLAKDKELKEVKSQRDQLMKDLLFSKSQEMLLQSQIVELQKRMDELQEESANLVGRNQRGSMENMIAFIEFTLPDIEEATENFSEALKIGEGGYGKVYRGNLQQTEVAIKRLNPQGETSHCAQGPSEFQMEVGVLRQLRHPNLVKLFGCCTEIYALVYEYVPNGNLEDRLNCKDNTPPLPWQIRVRIAIELCSVIMYLHSNKPRAIVHGDLKPSNIFLDANFVSKLGDFGICRLLCHEASSRDTRTLCCITNPKGTPCYIDPEFVETGELTVKSDVYAFGVILLQLLTGSKPGSIANKVKHSLKARNLKSLLDASAGHWPIDLAQKLARLALKCCDKDRKKRPELQSHVWKVLEPMKASFAAPSTSQRSPQDIITENLLLSLHCICPISQSRDSATIFY